MSLLQYHWTRFEIIAQLGENIRTTVGRVTETINTSVSIFLIFSIVLHVSIQFDFTDYIRRAYLLGDVTLSDSDVVIINNIQYLRNVSLIISGYSSRTVQNYMVWRFLMNLADDMPKQFREIKKQFNTKLQGSATQKSRKLTCATNVNSVMGLAVSKPYIKKYFDENARIQVCTIIYDTFTFSFPVLKVIGNDWQYSKRIY